MAPCYYWKDYVKKVPTDALSAGNGEDGEAIFIAQVFVRAKCDDLAIVPATIYPFHEVCFHLNGVRRAEKFMQILCTNDRNRFRWLAVEQENFHVKTIGHHLVRGGLENGKNVYIGRTQYKGGVVVGKVISFEPGVGMYFVHKEESLKVDAYQVLTFLKP